MESEIRELGQLIQRLAYEDRNLRVFGADVHEYQVGPTLSALELQRFERRHRIELPEDYRLYLELVGNGGLGASLGGAGPDYGVYSLIEREEFADSCEEFSDSADENILSCPFPQTYSLNLIKGQTHNLWRGPIPGALEIGMKGCSYTTHLIVSGEARGTIWNGWEHRYLDPTGVTFSQWMRDWAEAKISRIARDRLADGIEIGMSKSQAALACGFDFVERDAPWSAGAKYLRFKQFSIDFYLDQNEKITRIVKYSL
ncbi:MAG TPA: hypothetical protein VGB45_04365 [Abditibacterium sp.]|jgi:hypothetical protein